MKKELKLVIGLAIALILVALIILTKSYVSYINLKSVTGTPFNTLEILGQKIRLKDHERTYQSEIDCSTLIDSNVQIVYYRMKEDYRESKISLTSKVFSDNTITTDYKNITEIDINISVKDSKNRYEQVYHIKTTCKIDEEQLRKEAEEQARKEEEANNNQKKTDSNKKNTKTTKK